MDKNIEYKSIIMKMEKEKLTTINSPVLPKGFQIRFFQNEGDIKHWARIETTVLEFKNELDAEDYFTKAYFPYLNELRKRCLFIENEFGTPIATAMAWYSDSELGHQAALHWVSVDPNYQGLGLGKAIVQKALNVIKILEPNQAIWLHTQTWSHTAIRLYKKVGFNMVKSETLATTNTRNGEVRIYLNDYEEATKVLQNILPSKEFIELVNGTL